MAETGRAAKTRSRRSDNGKPCFGRTQRCQEQASGSAGGAGGVGASLGGLIERSRRASLSQLRACVRACGVYLHSSDSHQSVSRCRCSSHGINASSSRSSRLARGWARVGPEGGGQDNKIKWLIHLPPRALKDVADRSQDWPNCYFLKIQLLLHNKSVSLPAVANSKRSLTAHFGCFNLTCSLSFVFPHDSVS